jgi:hypothetical protein
MGQKMGITKRNMGSGGGMYVRPIYGSGTTGVLLGVPTSARPPFLGREQLDTEGFYSLGKGMKNVGLSASNSLSGLEDKLKRLTIKPVKSLKKNIKMNF